MMQPPPANLNNLWASLLVEELIRNGVDYYCLAPGSRCAPLTVAVADHPKASKSIHYDERGIAFHALGYGRATGRPAAVITTSGTAVSNLMPAVVEATMEHIPLLLLTADRPPELRDTSANQAIDQIKAFGDYVRWFVDLPCPETSIPPEMVLTTVDQAVYRCRWPEGGPVHINCMFREPLAPEREERPLDDYVASVDTWFAQELPFTDYVLPQRAVPLEGLKKVSRKIARAEKGLVVVGGLRRREDRHTVSNFLKTLGWPVCPDVTSGLRMGDKTGTVIAFYDALFGDRAFSQTHGPDVVLHLGGRLVSKKLARFLSQSAPKDYILVTDHPHRQDPGHEVTMRVESDIASFCANMADRTGCQKNGTWLSSWQKGTNGAHKALMQFADEDKNLSEPAIALLLSQLVPPDHALFLASSMPARDMNLFADPEGTAVCVGSNRGASGIDGTISSAAGFAAGCQGPVSLLTGDLAFLHDLNSLNYLTVGAYPVIIIVVNNNGGGIFSHLPISRFEAYFEQYFVTPHDLTFEQVSDMYGISYYRPRNRQDFVNAYSKALKKGTSAIVEVQIDRAQNVAIHRRLLSRMQKAVAF